MKTKIIKGLLISLPILLGILLFFVLVIARVIGVFHKGETHIITSSTLTDAIDISDLSTAQFTYNGIAELYKDEAKQKLKCYIRYSAKVKAGIDISEVTFDIDDEAMTVRPILPEITITANTVNESALSFLPENVKVEVSEALIACKEDAEAEATKASELFESAEDNLKSIIEALLYPILASEGYTIVWDE